MALSTEQLCYINNLLYTRSPNLYADGAQTSFEGRSLGDLVQMIDPSGNASSTCSAAEWARMKDAIMSDPQLMNLQVKDTYYDKDTGDGRCLLVDPSTNEAIVAFKGTGGGEWKDNFVAGASTDNSADPTISVQQQAAVDYADGFDLSGYDTVTVTGHSKGGNKAKLVALMNDEVDRCVSFDGQGFSDEFMEAHSAEIAANQHKIENHNVDGDFVNLLLNDIGETTYYEGQRTDGNYAKNHDPSTFFSDSGEMVVGQQTEAMQEMDQFLNSLLRSVDQTEKAELLDFAGELAHAALGWGGSADRAMDVLMDPRYADEIGYFVAYALRYEQETGRVTDVLPQVLEEMGLGDCSDIIDTARDVLGNEFLCNIVKNVMKLGDDVPDWMIEKFRELYEKDGKKLGLTDAEIRNLLNIIAYTAEYYEDIEIDKDAGADIEVQSTYTGGDSHITDGPGASVFDDADFDGSGMTIFVHFAELMECCEELRRAVEYYNEAIEMTRSAADELAASWVGEARDAFVEDQQNALRWYASLSDLAAAVVQTLRQNHDRYSDTASRLADIMRG